MAPDGRTRRRVLAGVGGAFAAGLAGCTGGGGDGGSGGTSGSGGETDGTSGGTDGGLDLREANVVGVAVAVAGDEYTFDVTLYHDDDGEDGYANWWQVETLDGQRLGRRDLAHAHGTRQFTRSAAVAVPDDVPCVVVRGHDQTHGYGGRAMIVTVETGASRMVEQGPEPASFSDYDCP